MERQQRQLRVAPAWRCNLVGAMRTREALVFAGGGQGIDTEKAQAWTVNRLWYEAGDPVASRTSLDAARRRGVGVGLKLNGTGPELAGQMHETLAEHGFGPTTGPLTCGAMFDAEAHEPDAIVAMLRGWRQLRRTRYTIWTLEPFQAGWFTPELVSTVNLDEHLLLAVQQYGDLAGDELYPAWAPAALDELEHGAGIRRERLTSFIGVKAGQQVPYGWAGILYGFGALAASPPTVL
jgi:hypothetical protein